MIVEKRDEYMTERRLDSGELNFSSLSKYRNAIYGLCAIWIVFFHGSETFNINDCEGIRMTLGLILRTGNCAVDVFMLLSGIGLYFSLSKKPKLSTFYWRRLTRIYLPYLILIVPYLIYTCIIAEQHIDRFFKTALAINYWLGDDEPIVLWYISAVIIFYLISPLLFKAIHYQEKNALLRTILMVAAVVVITIVLYHRSNALYYLLDKALTRLAVFIIGIYMGRTVKEKRHFSPLFLIICVMIAALGVPVCGVPEVHGAYYRISCSIVGVALTFVFAQSFVTLSKWKIDKFFNFFGAFSLEIYIATSIGRKIYEKTSWGAGHGLYKYLIFSLPFMLMAYLAYLIQKLLLRKQKPTEAPKI